MNAAPPQIASDASAQDRHLVGSVAWTAAAKWAAQILSWSSSLVIARLLSPSDFGLLAMTTLLLGLISVLSDLGISSAVINFPTLTLRQLRQLNTVSIGLAAVTFLIACASSTQIAVFFRQPELTSVVPAMGIGLVFSGMKAVPNALLQRALRFRVVSLIDVMQAATQAGITLFLVWLGLGYWALVLGGLTGAALSALLTVIWEHPGLELPHYSELKDILSFGSKVFVSTLCWYGYSNADFAVAGRVLGKTALGAYSLAWTLAMMPSEKLTSLIMRVTPGFFARHHRDLGTLRRYVLGLTKWISIIVFPVAFGLALISRDLVLLVLGPKWVAAVEPLMWLCLYVPFVALMTMFPQVLIAVGKPSIAMWNSILKLILMPPAFYVGSRWGPQGIAVAWLAVYPFLAVPLLWSTLRALDMGPAEYVKSLRSAAIGSAVMICTVWLLKVVMSSGGGSLMKTATEVGTGAIVYGFTLAWTEPGLIKKVLSELRGLGTRWIPSERPTA
jgi:PST family polysaccharide transporter